MLLLFLLLLLVTTGRALLAPEYSCWFPAYQNQAKVITLVLGYNNSGTNDVIIYAQQTLIVGSGVKNVITPLIYNHPQPDVFKVGDHPFAFTVVDTNNVLRSGGQIIYFLSLTNVTVSLAQLSRTNKCAIKYARACAVKFPSFCEDGSYCDGAETCYPGFIPSDSNQEKVGTCLPGTPVSCAPGTICSEEALACVVPVGRPSAAPTTPAPTATPHDTVEDVVVTPSPSPSPPQQCSNNSDCATYNSFCDGDYSCQGGVCLLLDLAYQACSAGSNCSEQTRSCLPPVSEGACREDAECVRYATFCGGPFICDSVSESCVVENPDYTPCGALSATAKAFNARGTGNVTVICVESTRSCVSYYSCARNADCVNGAYCSGTQRCVASVCQRGLPVVCRNASVRCDEKSHCTGAGGGEAVVIDDTPSGAPTTSSDNDSGTNTGLIIFACIFIILVVLVALISVVIIVRSQENRRRYTTPTPISAKKK